MNTKRKVKDYIGKKVAVECSSEKEWELLLKLTSSERKNHFNVSFNKCFDLEKLGNCWSISSKEDIIENGWTVYPASDFLKEDKPFNVGDLVYLEKHYKHETENRDSSTGLPLNSPLEIKKIDFISHVYGNEEKEWVLWFKGISYGHPACKFKLWQNTISEYIEILHEHYTYTQKGRTYKVLSWESQNCWVVCNVKCGSYEPDSRLCIDAYYKNKSWWRPSTKEAYDLQNETKMLPYPTYEKYFKAVVTKDIHREHISTRGSMPELMPKGYQTWFDNKYLELIENKKENEVVRPENNRWSANIPAEYFEIVEDKKAFKFEEGKWYKMSKTDNIYRKCCESGDICKYNEAIDEYFKHRYSSGTACWTPYLADLSEIQPYLPEDYPDKFKIETPINKVENYTSFKVGDYITIIDTVINKSEFIGDVLKITEIIDEGKNYGLWFKHFPESFSGGGFRYNAYKDKIRQSTPEEIKNSFIISQYPLTPEQCFKTKPLIKNRNPVVKETIKSRNRLEIKPIKQTIKLKHYVNI